MINEVDQVLSFSNKNTKVEVLPLAMNGYVASDLRELDAQALNGKSFEKPDRCWRCRLPFGCAWMSLEANPASETEK